jgi:hypothetical protein
MILSLTHDVDAFCYGNRANKRVSLKEGKSHSEPFEWLGMDRNGPEWMEMDRNGRERPNSFSALIETVYFELIFSQPLYSLKLL